jgi:hypothetical protein
MILKWLEIIGIALFFIGIGLWIVSLPFSWTKSLGENNVSGIVFRILLTIIGIVLLYVTRTKKDRFLPSFQAEDLDVMVSADVFKKLINKILENYDGVRLNTVFFKKSHLAGITDLVVALDVNDPFSLSEVLKEIGKKIETSIKESIGDSTGIHLVMKVKGFEVRGDNV